MSDQTGPNVSQDIIQPDQERLHRCKTTGSLVPSDILWHAFDSWTRGAKKGVPHLRLLPVAMCK